MEDPREKARKDMLDRGILYVKGEITGEIAERFGYTMVWLNALQRHTEITLYIDSNGGSVVAGLQMYEMIRQSKIPVNGVVFRRAFSTAAILLQACHKRGAFSSAEILFHDTKGEIPVLATHEEIDKMLLPARERQRTLHRIIATASGKTVEDSAAFSKIEMLMSAVEALERGFIDEIIDHTPR